MNKLMKYHVQSVLVPVGHYKTIEQAAAHVKEIGYNPEYKEPHITNDYIRFRQYEPKAGENYRTEYLDAQGDKAIIAVPELHKADGLKKFRIPANHDDQIQQYHPLMSIYHPSHHNKAEVPGPRHEHYHKQQPDQYRERVLMSRFKNEMRELEQYLKKKKKKNSHKDLA